MNNNLIEAFYRDIIQKQCDHKFNHSQHMANYHKLYHIDHTKAMLSEMHHLSMDETRKLSKLRMGYENIGDDYDYNSTCYCKCNNTTIKTAAHVILECPMDLRVQNRQTLKSQLIEIDQDFNNNDVFNNIDLLLFPHLKYPISQLNKIDNVLQRINILKIILDYCRYQFPD